jgi:general secretion pathway protein G
MRVLPLKNVEKSEVSAMHRVRHNAGFTLIEIMVVVFILGLLVTLVAPKIIGRTDEARRTKAAADIKGITEALHLFKLDNGFYPSSGDGLNGLVQRPPNAKNFSPDGYLDKLPIDPWGNPYVYFSDGQEFIVKSYGADGQEGGEGKNADIDSRENN